MGKTQLAENGNPVVHPVPEGSGGPLPHPVHRQDGCPLEGRRKKRAGRMRLVVLRKIHLWPLPDPRLFQRHLDVQRYPQLLPQPQRHRHHEGLQPLRRHAQIGFQDPVELGDGLVVERHGIQLAGFHASFRQAILHRIQRESRIVLLACEALLLGGRDDPPVANQGRGGIMVERANPKNVHENCLR